MKSVAVRPKRRKQADLLTSPIGDGHSVAIAAAHPEEDEDQENWRLLGYEEAPVYPTFVPPPEP